MREPHWLSRVVVDTIQHELLAQYGGVPGLRDDNLLESALARARTKWSYQPDADLAMLAAAFGFGLAKNHAYADANKRVAFMAMYTFLGIAGRELEAPEPEAVAVMRDVAAGEMSEAELAAWIRTHLTRFKL